jgi:ribosomal protein S18 acetylase RimI-like enzyme
MPELVIRQVTRADLDPCFAIESICYGPEGATCERIALRIDSYPQGFLVAVCDSQVVGFINSGATDRDDISDEALKDLVGHEPAGRKMVIFSLAVQPEFQRQGVGRALLQRFTATARRLDKQRILLLCRPELIVYYQREGFLDRGPSASTHGGLEWHEMCLTLPQSASPPPWRVIIVVGLPSVP